MFMVLSSWQSHCESSPGSCDEFNVLNELNVLHEFNVSNWCSGHSVVTNRCWIKYYCRRKVIITIFISDNHRISKAITAHPFKLAKILSSQVMLTYIVRHIFRMPMPTNFKVDIRMEDDDPHQPQAP